METLYKIFGWVNDNILWGVPMIVLILVAGILLTARSKFFQVLTRSEFFQVLIRRKPITYSYIP